VPPDVAVACKRGPERASFEGKQYVWKAHEDNQRAFTKPSVIRQLGDEYEKVDSSYRRKYWRCGLRTKINEIIEASECLKNWWDRGLIQQHEEEEEEEEAIQGASEIVEACGSSVVFYIVITAYNSTDSCFFSSSFCLNSPKWPSSHRTTRPSGKLLGRGRACLGSENHCME
jgi:hypothetical protein